MKIANLFGLRGRIFTILGALVLITLVGGSIMIWYTYRMQSLFEAIRYEDIEALKAAQELEIELANQKGFVSYFFMDRDPKWLDQLEIHRHTFVEQLRIAGEYTRTEAAHRILADIEKEYKAYIASKDKVISLYKAGDLDAGARLHEEVRPQFFKVLDLCEQYRNFYTDKINTAFMKSGKESNQLRLTAVTAMSAAAIMGALLAFVLVAQILKPIRILADEAGRAGTSRGTGDDVAALRTSIHGLIEDYDHTHDELERSREMLFQAEKMAMLGKLAAEVAHSIRNPMTSIKMRLFSLERSLKLSPVQREDFEVVSEEMRNLDNVVRNFLEFSRPPKLKKQKINVSDIIDMTLQLMQSQLDLNNIKVIRNRRKYLPKIEGDPELLKEVLVNLIVNACDAMSSGGKLTVTEDDAVAEMVGRAIMVKVSDTGPGIQEGVMEKLWEPFFSTKDDGTGLGLSIAKRIIEEHGGNISVQSEEGEGASFKIILPVPEENA